MIPTIGDGHLGLVIALDPVASEIVVDSLDQVGGVQPRVGWRGWPIVFGSGAVIGVLGGLNGLGGAEFRLPLLIGLFGFAALQAVILNKAMSLIVVLTALPARLFGVPFSEVIPHWTIAVNLLAGSLVGAWLAASWATRMRSTTLYRVLAVLLVLIAATLVATHLGHTGSLNLSAPLRITAGIAAGVLIGMVAALMSVAGGELLIPTIVLLFAVDIKIAGSLSLAVSLPTMLVAFARYSRDQSFVVLRQTPGSSSSWRPDPSPGPSAGDCSWAASPPKSSSRCWPLYSYSPRCGSGDTPRTAPTNTNNATPPQP